MENHAARCCLVSTCYPTLHSIHTSIYVKLFYVVRRVPLHSTILGGFPYVIGIGPGILSRVFWLF